MLLLAAMAGSIVGCSGSGESGSGGPSIETTDFTEGTLASPSTPATTNPSVVPAPGGASTTGRPTPGSTTEARPGSEAAVFLRVEGAPGTRFSGLCSVDGQEKVVTGRVPKRYLLTGFQGRPFSCAIEKQDDNEGSLKVILLVGDSTRSVQQTDAEGGTLRVSYPGG